MNVMTEQQCDAKLAIVDAAVAEIFERMLWEECRISKVDWAEGERICAWIEMSGAPDGCCSVEVAASSGDLLTDTLLGSQGDWDDELIEDAVGELCNMITGGIKSRLGVRAGACTMSLPKVARFGGDSKMIREIARTPPLRVDPEEFDTVNRLYWFGQASTLAVRLQLRRD
jgi:chemotaxis protein CheX